MGLTETWYSGVNDAEVKPDDFEVYRKDRAHGRGGGVLMFVHNSLQSAPCLELTDSNFEDSVWCTVKLSTKHNLLVGTIYRSTTSSLSNLSLIHI